MKSVQTDHCGKERFQYGTDPYMWKRPAHCGGESSTTGKEVPRSVETGTHEMDAIATRFLGSLTLSKPASVEADMQPKKGPSKYSDSIDPNAQIQWLLGGGWPGF